MIKAVIVRRFVLSAAVVATLAWSGCSSTAERAPDMPSAPTSRSAARRPRSFIDEMSALTRLRNDGVIGQAEFDARRRKLVERYAAAERQPAISSDAAMDAPVRPEERNRVAQREPTYAPPVADPADQDAPAGRQGGRAAELEALARLHREGVITSTQYMEGQRQIATRYPAAEREPRTGSYGRMQPAAAHPVQALVRPMLVFAALGSDFKKAVGGGLAAGVSIHRTHDIELEAIRFQTTDTSFTQIHYTFMPVLANYAYNAWFGNFDLRVGVSTGITIEQGSIRYYTLYRENAYAFTFGGRVGVGYALSPNAALTADLVALRLSQTDLTTSGDMALVDLGATFRF